MSAEAPVQYAEVSVPAAVQAGVPTYREALPADHRLRFTKDLQHLQAPQRALHTTVLPKGAIPEAGITEEPTKAAPAMKEAVHQASAEAAHQPAIAGALPASQEAHLQGEVIAEVHPAAIDDKHKLLQDFI